MAETEVEEPIISNEEADSLLEPEVGSRAGQVNIYELNNLSQTFVNQPIMQSVLENFRVHVGESMVDFLHQNVDIRFDSFDYQPVGEYLKKESFVFNLVQIKNADAFFLINLSNKLLFNLVSIIYGGFIAEETEIPKIASETSRRIGTRLTERFIPMLRESMKPLMAMNPQWVKCVPQGQLISDFSDIEIFLVLKYECTFGNVSSYFHVCLPHTLLEKINNERIQAKRNEAKNAKDPLWQARLKDNVLDAPIEVSANFPEIHLTLAELMRLSSGDVMTIGNPEEAQIRLGKKKLFNASLGAQDETCVLTITD
jgi:flagellar motor switch protein FliM